MGKKITFLMTFVALLLMLTLMIGCGETPENPPVDDPGTTDDTWKSDATQHWKGDSAKENHTFGAWETVTQASCTAEGKQKQTCTVCGYVAEEPIPKTEHTFNTSKWESDDESHWYGSTCGCKDEVSNFGAHTFVEGVCTTCKKKQPGTKGLIIEKIGSTYTVVGVEGKLKGSVVIPEYTTDYFPVKAIAPGAFDGQDEMTGLVIPAAVEVIENYTFRDCSSLVSVTLPTAVKEIGAHAFDGCASLTAIRIPEKVTEIGAYAFNGCTSLETVEFLGTSKLRKLGTRAFADCTKLATIAIPSIPTTSTGDLGASVVAGTKFANTASNYEGGCLYSGTNLLQVDPATTGAVTVKAGTKRIADRAFQNCTEILTVSLPSGVKIGKDVYVGCTKLIENATIVTEGDYVFYNGTNGYELVAYNGTATTLTLPASANGGNYVIGAYAFAGNETLTSVTIPAGVTAIGAHAFDGCSVLATVAMGTGVVSVGDYAFNGCIAVTSLTIGTGVETIGASAFNGCLLLAEIRIPDSVVTIGDHAFANCKAAVSVYVGSGVTAVGADAFLNSNAIDNIYVTNLAAWCGIEFADKEAHPFGYYRPNDNNKFYVNQVELTALTTPAGVTKIGNYAFFNCDGITSVTIGADLTTIGKGAFVAYANCTRTVTCSTTGWLRNTRPTNGGVAVTITTDEIKDYNMEYCFYIPQA